MKALKGLTTNEVFQVSTNGFEQINSNLESLSEVPMIDDHPSASTHFYKLICCFKYYMQLFSLSDPR